jgi:hypothetical protein
LPERLAILKMKKPGCINSLIIVVLLFSLFSVQGYSQQLNYKDTISATSFLKPKLNYSAGSTITVIPHFGAITGFTFSPSFSVPLSPKWTIDGGVIAGYYYSSLPDLNGEGTSHTTFNNLTVYGSASYHINSQLTVYGIGLKQLAATSPYDILPKSSYTIGSTYKFGNFSIGVNFQTSRRDGAYTQFPYNGSQGFYSPFGPLPGGF